MAPEPLTLCPFESLEGPITIPILFALLFRNLSSQTTKEGGNFCSSFETTKLKFIYFLINPSFSHRVIHWEKNLKTNSDIAREDRAAKHSGRFRTNTINRSRQVENWYQHIWYGDCGILYVKYFFKVAKSKAMVVCAELRQTKLASVLGRRLGARCIEATITWKLG